MTNEKIAKSGVNKPFLGRKIDFGVGIYLTSNKRQAEAWAKRKKKGTVYVFDIDMKDISVFVDNYRFTIYNTSNFFASC